MKDASISVSLAPAPRVFPPAAAPPRLGVLMLDTRFPRPPGDVGHPGTWREDTDFLAVSDVGPRDAVRASRSEVRQVLPAFEMAALSLVQRGAAAITTSCGFLVLLQSELQQAVPVPVVTSSLLLLPSLLEAEDEVGVLTISAQHLGEEHLRSAGVLERRLGHVQVQGVAPESEFSQAILGNRLAMDFALAERDVVAAATALQLRAPGLRTLVLECTNMPPYAAQVREATGWRVMSLMDCPELAAYRRTVLTPLQGTA